MMARNKVQFQKGLSEAQFAVLYGTEDQCREAVMRWRWPSGFVCPVCAGEHHSFVKSRALYQCTAGRRQTSVIAGTIFAATKVPLCTWFRAMYHLTQSKGGISSCDGSGCLDSFRGEYAKAGCRLKVSPSPESNSYRAVAVVQVRGGFWSRSGSPAIQFWHVEKVIPEIGSPTATYRRYPGGR